ncbi:hypothetical protein BST65_17090 [Bradyrhizobium canariense]|nr:hypothetical protein BST65_17090 [Bradyrhizobium canariense]OSI34274.1 hypothetical protein BST66_10880 [Bradyrhizobium canariense]OSI45737.1 hypothetical protein BSZ20_12030 [Bradyrhizobium canariense]OSI48565.1 hypothetical protein BST67_18000 [Bradyrhizobium canariense]OSI53611.1 hypothetical protein BSZ15_25085 [Bradyrhizobium canariense]
MPSISPNRQFERHSGDQGAHQKLHGAARGELAVPSIIESVRTAHPGASAAEVTNFVTTIYCPLILKDATLSDAEKRAHLKSFSADVFKKVPPT